jgi:hypothetical protein
MPTNMSKIFIASPSGLAEERKAFRNDGWEDMLGGIGRPQGILNEDVQKSDFCI